MSKKKIICKFLILLLMVTTYPISANITSSNQQIEPDGKIFFMAHSTGPCGIAWGYGIGNASDHTSDAYMEIGKGIIINFGIMSYHSQYSPTFTNYLVQDNDEEVLWKVSEKTLMNINWEHKEVKHKLRVICTPIEETTGTFMINQKAYLICSPPTYQPKDHKENCMAFTGFHRNGSKTESISGFAVLLAIREENSSSMFPEPWIMLWLFQIKDGGIYEPILTALWAKNSYYIPDMGIIIPKAKTFNVNFWALKLK